MSVLNLKFLMPFKQTPSSVLSLQRQHCRPEIEPKDVLFVQQFLSWWKANDLPEEEEFKSVVVLGYEFADYKGIAPLTRMSLSKALQNVLFQNDGAISKKMKTSI